MRTNLPPNAFHDLQPGDFLGAPNVIFRAERLAVDDPEDTSDHYSGHPRMTRHVRFTDSNGLTWEWEMVFYVHPTGAADITLGTVAYSATNVATYTPTLQSRLISEAGALSAAGAAAEDIAGMLLDDYYTDPMSEVDTQEKVRATVISAGDGLWLIRRGECDFDATAAVADNAMLKIDAAGLGKVVSHAPVAVTDLLGDAHPRGISVGIATEAIGAAGKVKGRLLLPPRWGR